MYTCKYFPIYLIACLISILCLDACGGNSSKSGKSISDSDSIGNDIMQGENHAIQYNIIKNKIPYNIVNHIGSSAISVMFADTIQFNSNNIYKVTHYRFDETNRKHLLSETQYLPDGRIQEKKDYENDEIQFHKKYYFDKDFNKLILEENIQHAYQRNIYSWLFYDDNSNLTEEFDYETNLQKKNVRFWSYNSYSYEFNSKDTIVEKTELSYDTTAYPVRTYFFSYPYLTYSTEDIVRKSQFINDSYQTTEIKGYVFSDRNVYFKYDDNGYIRSETWYKPEGRLENKIEYSYSDNYRERVEQQYQRLGTEKAVKIVKKYNDLNDLVFEQHIYPDYPSGIKDIEYVYDDKGNWTDRNEYYTEYSKGVPSGERKLSKHEQREIEYYTPEQVIKEFTNLPDFPEEMQKFRKNILQYSEDKQDKIDAFNEAVETGDYDSEIKLQLADNISDFTPKYWTVSATAYGDLDDVEGDEAAVVYLTPVGGEFAYGHCLAIYKKEGSKWKLWHQTFSPVLDSGSGGMMGNPFDGISIDKRAIVISHFGGSRQKWEYTHRYRFQNNNWYLIGAKISFGAPCDYNTVLDYNLSTGDIIAERTYDRCEDTAGYEKERVWTEKFNQKGSLPLMDEFIPGENKIRIANQSEDIYY